VPLTKPLNVIATAAANCFRPGYWRALAQTTLAWRWRHARRPLKVVTLTDVYREPHEIRMWQVPAGSFGDTPLPDLLALCTLVRRRRPAKLFEFGTFRGLTTLQLALNTDDTARIFTLDIPPENRSSLTEGGWDATVSDAVVGELYRSSPYAAKVTQILCDSRKFDPEPYAGQMDFIFIDASHEFDFVRNDTEKALRMAAKGGIIAWHDYSAEFTGVKRVLEDLARSREVCWVAGTYVAYCIIE